MGYRHKIGILSKELHNQIKDFDLEQLREWYRKEEPEEAASNTFEDEDTYVPCYDITKEIFELGKYYEDEFLKEFRSPVFSKEEVEEYYRQDNDFYIISQEGFIAIIKEYHKKIKDYFKDLAEGEEKEDPYGRNKIEEYLKSKLREWDNNYDIAPYSLHLNHPTIVDSWKYEYAIFELVRIYKSIDWENNYVTITAW